MGLDVQSILRDHDYIELFWNAIQLHINMDRSQWDYDVYQSALV
jgi:hypothetical protein